MPTKPLSHAQRLGRTASDRAYDKTRRQADPAVAAAARIRNSARWQHVRRLVLARQPLCADPYGWHAAVGRIEVATQVDHIVGLAAGGAAYDEGNLQSLCTRCHGRKTAKERQT
jgi:5-methylcytosine-specific restriction enzyme A